MHQQAMMLMQGTHGSCGQTGRAPLYAVKQATYSLVYLSTVNRNASGRTSRASLHAFE